MGRNTHPKWNILGPRDGTSDPGIIQGRNVLVRGGVSMYGYRYAGSVCRCTCTGYRVLEVVSADENTYFNRWSRNHGSLAPVRGWIVGITG